MCIIILTKVDRFSEKSVEIIWKTNKWEYIDIYSQKSGYFHLSIPRNVFSRLVTKGQIRYYTVTASSWDSFILF